MVSGFIRTKKNLFLVILFIYFAVGCSSSLKKDEEIIDAQFYFNRGMEMMSKKDYVKAIADFETVVNSFPGSVIVDHAQFMLGEAHYMSEEYLTAAYEYERVYADYPSSNFAPDAHYKKALCYYMESPIATLDQENTQLAIDEFNRFIDNYPTSKFVSEAQSRIEELKAKLALKEYFNAETYRKLKDYEAALIYYRFVINKYPRTIWADYARCGIGEVNFKMEEYEKAKEMFLLILNADVDVKLKKKAEKFLEEIEKIQTK